MHLPLLATPATTIPHLLRYFGFAGRKLVSIKIIIAITEMVILYTEELENGEVSQGKRAKFHALDGQDWKSKVQEVLNLLGLGSMAHIRRVTIEFPRDELAVMDIEIYPQVYGDWEMLEPAFQVMP